jgi:hypothetical protein
MENQPKNRPYAFSKKSDKRETCKNFGKSVAMEVQRAHNKLAQFQNYKTRVK